MENEDTIITNLRLTVRADWCDQIEEAFKKAADLKALEEVMSARVNHAEKEYLRDRFEGDGVSNAITLAAFVSWRSARDLVRNVIQSSNT